MILLFTILYLVPITSFSSNSLYQKVLISNAAISALRLHQILPGFQLSREYLRMMFVEDSAHYLFYSLIFMSNLPITLVLLPITLFSFLHFCSAINDFITSTGINNELLKNFIRNILQNQREILLTIALTEVVLMPTILFSIMAGLAGIFTPLMYYHFVTLRYSSRRNPYNRQAFHAIRIFIQNFASSPNCPELLRNILLKGIAFTCRLAPAVLQ